jgi:phage terminase large subunit GpA-like protein
MTSWPPSMRNLVTAVAAATIAIATIRQAGADGLRPEVQLTVSAWSDAHRRLPKKSSAEPGPWRTERTPYLREIMDCLSTTSEVEEVVMMKAAQVGGSEAILNAIGYVIDHAPGPIIVVQPTVELAKRFSRQRLEPLVTSRRGSLRKWHPRAPATAATRC